MSLRKAALAAGAVLCAAGLAVPALAARPAGADSGVTVYACVVTSTHRFVQVSEDTPLACPSGSVAVSWPGVAGAPMPSPTPTDTTPGPSPTTPSPTGTTPAPGPTGTGAPCVTSDLSGSCAFNDPADLSNSNGYNTYVGIDTFNPIAGISQTLTARGPGDWSLAATMPAGNTAVVSYPDIQQLYQRSDNTPDPLSGFTSMTSTFTESMPHDPGTIAEAAYDIWTDYPADIMIWVDDNRPGSLGGATDLGQATIGGQDFEVYQFGTNGEIIFSLDGTGGKGTFAHETSGGADILATVQWVNAHVPGAHITGFGQVNFGFELCSTGGAAETFGVSSYTLTDACAGGGTGCHT